MSDIIIDSELTFEQATKQNPASACPTEILRQLRLLEVTYYSFDSKLHRGQVVVHKELVKDITDAFTLFLQIQFPIQSVIPIADDKFYWDDEVSMQANNTSSFNYRFIATTNELSYHAYGRAIDINPLFNPYIKGDFVQPAGAVYHTDKPGTIIAGDPIVRFFKKRGWVWGGEWAEEQDYQHFEKA